MARVAERGQGYRGNFVPKELLPKEISMKVYEKAICGLIAPNIAKADVDFEGQLACGKKVSWVRRDTTNYDLFQQVQLNEEPEPMEISICHDEAQICGQRKFKIKLSSDQLRELECNGYDAMYFDTVERTIFDTLEQIWNDSHLAHVISMAAEQNTGNNALGMGINLGSPDNPIVIKGTAEEKAAILKQLYTDMNLVATEGCFMGNNGEVKLIMPNIVSNASLAIFDDLNVCCSQNNVMITGQMEKTIYGFDTFKTNRKIMTTMYNGKRIYYIIAAHEEASGFVSDMYNFKWHEEAFDYFLVGTEVHGSYVVQPENIAIAVVTFE